MRRNDIRNVAIIAHVDHGKTTLVDRLLRQSGQFRESAAARRLHPRLQRPGARARHHHPGQEHRPAATSGVKINLIDTPGHADFGGEVERVAADGRRRRRCSSTPPRGRCRRRGSCCARRSSAGLRPIVVINKIDRPDARPARGAQRGLRPVRRAGRRRRHARLPVPSTPPAAQGYRHAPTSAVPADRPAAAVRRDPRSTSRPRTSTPTRRCRCWSPRSTAVELRRPHRHRPHRRPARSSKGQTRRPAASATARSTERTVAQLYVFDRLGRVEVDEVDGRRHRAPSSASTTSTSATRSADLEHRRAAAARCTVDEPTLDMIFTHQRLAVRRPRRQVRHQPPAPRAAVSRSWSATSPCACGRSKRQRRVRRLRPRPAAPVGPDREHAPRGLRAVGRQAAGHHSRRSTARRTSRSSTWSSTCPSDKLGPRDGAGRQPPRRAATRWTSAATTRTSSSRSPPAA